MTGLDFLDLLVWLVIICALSYPNLIVYSLSIHNCARPRVALARESCPLADVAGLVPGAPLFCSRDPIERCDASRSFSVNYDCNKLVTWQRAIKQYRFSACVSLEGLYVLDTDG
jgi:hypothetical protein